MPYSFAPLGHSARRLRVTQLAAGCVDERVNHWAGPVLSGMERIFSCISGARRSMPSNIFIVSIMGSSLRLPVPFLADGSFPLLVLFTTDLSESVSFVEDVDCRIRGAYVS